ncbi:MAG: spore coat associated protein CotJA [Lachnospiraceae bacterium]|nr:spore coat associated protein CotJA [Lachnospiraceae bacterium]
MSGPIRPGEFPVAMAYVPWQRWHTVYDLEKGLSTGTIFPELNKPFLGVRGGCR